MSGAAVDKQTAAGEPRSWASDRTAARRLIQAGSGLIVLWLLITALRIARPAAAVLEHQRTADRLLAQGWQQADPDDVERLVIEARQDIHELNRAARPLTAIGGAFVWLPKVGPLLADSRTLLTMAVNGSDAAAYALPALKPSLALLQAEGGGAIEKLPQLLTVLDAVVADLRLASASMDELALARDMLAHEDEYPFRARQVLDQLDANLPLARDGLRLATVMPTLGGLDAPRAFLLMAQNEDELRPAGGFLTGAGYLVVDGGRIVSLDFMDANLVDDWQHKPYDLPPQPYTDFMGMDIFLFRDANFWPDFATSAEQAMQLYSYGRDLPLQGALAIDQRFLEMLFESIGAVYVPEFEANVGAENVVAQMRQQWGVREDGEVWLLERKSFMGPLAGAIVQRLQGDVGNLDVVNLARHMQAAAEQRHLQLYFRDPVAQDVVDGTSWSGRQANDAGQDFLLVVDTSMGFNKVNPVIRRSVEYQVQLGDGGTATADLTVRYLNEAPPDGEPCTHGSPYNAEIQYADLLHDCYWNYLRVYVPSGSQLLAGSRHPLDPAYLLSGRQWDGETRFAASPPTGLALLENFILVPPGEELVFSVRYQLPSAVVVDSGGRQVYHLRVNKQAGLINQSLRVLVTVPEGREIIATTPAAAQLSARSASFELLGLVDEEVMVQYR